MNSYEKAVVASVVFLLSLSACQRNTATQTQASPTARQPVEATTSPSPAAEPWTTLEGTIDLQGDIKGTAEVSDDPKSALPSGVSCKTLAAEGGQGEGGTKLFTIPGTQFSFNQEPSVVWLNVQPYQGPRRYGKEAFPPTKFLATDETLAGIIIDRLGDNPRVFKVVDTTVIGAEIKNDASGTVSFTGLMTDAGAKVSGKISWTCKDS